MAIDNDKLLAAIDAAKSRAYGSDQATTLGLTRAQAIEYYLGLNTDPAPEGRSQVVDRSVYETIHTILPSLVRIFATSSEEVCRAMPIGPDDEQGAEQMTAVLNNVVTDQNAWEQICSDWIHDACLLANGYCMAYWDQSERLIREKYEGQSDDQVTALMQDSDVTILEHTASIDEEATKQAQDQYQQMLMQWQQAAQQMKMQYEQAMGQWKQAAQQLQAQGQPIPPHPQPPQMPPQPVEPKPIQLHDLTIEREETEGKVCIKVLAPEHCYIGSDTPDWTLTNCKYFEFQQPNTLIADLRAQGLEVPDDVSDQETPEFMLEDLSRDRFGERGLMAQSDDSTDDGGMRRVVARMIWVRADAENDGQARMYYVLAVGRTILYAEPCSRIMVSSMTPQPLPHRHMGMSICETVKDIQDIRTAITRGGLDNLYLANAGRHAISSRVNLADFLDARPGGVVRMLDHSLPTEGHIMPLTHPVVFDQVIGSLEYFDQVRQQRTGASHTFSGTDVNLNKQTATGTIANQNQSSMRVEHIARMMAPAVEDLFSIVQELIQKHQNKSLTIKLNGEWTVVDPQAWRTKRDMRISVGVGAGNRDSMYLQLEGIFQKQMAMAPLGLAGPEQIHATVIEQAKLAGFANGAKFWKDPKNQPPTPPPPSPDMIKAQSAKEIKTMELQADAQKFQAESQLEQHRIELEAQANERAKAAELQVQAANDRRDAEREQWRIQMEAQMKALDRAAEDKQAMLRLELDKYKADLDAQTKLIVAGKVPSVDPAMFGEMSNAIGSMHGTIQQLVADMQSPATIVRDPQSGRAIGVQRGNMVKKIIRGPDGRAVGVQ